MEQNPQPARVAGRQLGRVMGVPVFVSPSMVLLSVLVAVLYAEVGRQQPGLSGLFGYLLGFGFVACLLGSVLLHEVGHAVAARRHGIGVRGITLDLLGGYTQMDADTPGPRADLLVALAGPAVSLVLGVVTAVAALALPDHTLLDRFVVQLAASNIIIAVFNILPGLPLDGGRALRAGVWAYTGDRHRGTEVAGQVGRFVAVAGVALVAVLINAGVLASLALPLMLLVALTLWRGAGQAVRVARISRRFALIDLARLARPIFAVPSGTPLAEARRRQEASGAAQAVLCVADASGRPVAVVDQASAEAVPAGRRPWIPVDEVARTVVGLPSLPVELSGERVIEVVRNHPGVRYVVTSGEDVVGVLQIADLARLLEPERKMKA